MKSFIRLLLFTLLITAVLPVFAENLTLDGVTYERIKWGKSTPVEVTLYHRKGVIRVKLETLPEYLQERFDYDPAAASEFLQEQEAKKKREKERRKYVSLQEPDEDDMVMPPVDLDQNMFYLKRFAGGTFYGPFDCKVGTAITVDSGTYDIIRVSGELFTLEARKSKKVFGPYWLKDYADASLDGTSFRVMRPSTVRKEVRKVSDERKRVKSAQRDILAEETGTELQTATGLQRGTLMRSESGGHAHEYEDERKRKVNKLNQNKTTGLKKSSLR